METYDILVIDDDPDIIELYEAFMGMTDYSYRIVASSVEALELLKTMEFKVFIIDINLGVNSMTGVDLGIKIREKYEDALIYALTGHSTLFDNFDPAIAGFDDVYDKPFGYVKILKVLKTILRSIK